MGNWRGSNAAETQPPDIKALAHSGRDIINDTDVLARFGEDFRKVIAGEQNTGKLLYLVATSRLFDKAMHAAVKGPSSGGKWKTARASSSSFHLNLSFPSPH